MERALRIKALKDLDTAIELTQKGESAELFAKQFAPLQVLNKQQQTSGFAEIWKELIGNKSRHILIAAAMSLILVIGITSSFSNPFSPPVVLASNCTLTILNGAVLVRDSSTTAWENGADGMTLAAGSQVKTAAESQALLTFFEGSTIRLDADTQLEIEQANSVDDHYTAIVLKQYLGQTWSIVVKLSDPRSKYEIHTPSAVASVRGTQFVTTVNDDGHTQVQVNEGAVAVEGHGEEVTIPAGYHVQVENGGAPSQPTSNDTGVNDNNSSNKNNGNAYGLIKGNEQKNTDNRGQEQSNLEKNNHGKNQENTQNNAHNIKSNVNAGGNSDANSNAGGNSDANSNAGGNSGANSNAGGNSDANSNAGGNSDANSNAGGNSDANSNAGGNSDANSNAGGNSDANSNAGGNSDANSNTGGNSDANSNACGNSDTNSTAGSNSCNNGNGRDKAS